MEKSISADSKGNRTALGSVMWMKRLVITLEAGSKEETCRSLMDDMGAPVKYKLESNNPNINQADKLDANIDCAYD